MNEHELEAQLASYVRLSHRLGKRLIHLTESVQRRFRYSVHWNPHRETYSFLKAPGRSRRFFTKAMQQFHIDKAVNVIVESLGEDVIKAFWAGQGKRVQVYENRRRDLEDQREYDRRDSLGYLWEIKNDRLCWQTGNVFVEETVFTSQAHFYLIFAQGRAYILERLALCELVKSCNGSVRGGDDDRAVGTLVPLSNIQNLEINT